MVLAFFTLLSVNLSWAQTVCTNHLANNAQSGTTFNFINNNAFAVVIGGLSAHLNTGAGSVPQLWFKPGAINGAPGTINAGNGWTALPAGAPINGLDANGVVPVLSGLGLIVPANTTMGLALNVAGVAGALRYSTLAAGTYDFPSGGCILRTGTTISFGGWPTPTFTPRGFIGCVTFVAATPCAGTPNPGNTLASAVTSCPTAPVNLSLQNLTSGSGVSYAWEVSTTSAGGPYSPVAGTAGAITVNPAVQSWYRCNVTCVGNGTGTSNPVQINMDPSFTNPQGFTAGVLNNGCWSNTGAGLAYSPVNGNAVAGAGSARWNFWNIGVGVSQTLTSPFFAAVPTGWQVKFDVAGQNYAPADIDNIFLEEFNGGVWVLLQTMTNNIGDVLATVPGSNTGLFSPTLASQWASRNYVMTPGSTRIRFRGVSGFGNDVFIDNISVAPVPVCNTPAGQTALTTSNTTATISWINTTALSYTVEIRSSGAPGSGPVGLVSSTSGILGTPFLATGLPSNTNLQAYVQGNCGVDGISDWSGVAAFRTGHCEAAGSATGVDELIANVSVSNLNNTTSETAGYVDFTGGTPISMAPGVVYPLSVGIGPTVYTSDQILVWIDLNNDLDFADPNEQRFVSLLPLGANPVVGNLSVPTGTPAGNYRMRVRLHDSGFGPNNTPCGNSGFGQVEDYTVTVCGAAVATVSVSDNCLGNVLDAVVNITSLGSGASATITYAVNGGSPATVAGALGSNSLTALGMTATSADNVTISVSNGTLCGLSLGTFYSNCADTLDCLSVATYGYCYQNNDTRTFHYVAEAGQTVSINFIQGSIDLADVLNFYDGANNLATSLGGGNFSGDLSSADFTTTGTDLYFEMGGAGSNGSNSCFDGGQTTPWQWTVQCTPDCTAPQGFAEYVLPISCTPPGFFVDVNVTDAGAAQGGGISPLSTVDIVWSGGATGSVTGVLGGSTTQIGPFPLGSTVTVKLVHGTNSLCDLILGNFTQASTCPPTNDECVNAQTLTIAGVAGCPAGGVIGTTAFGTNSTGGSIPAPTCNNAAGTIQDVWYSFNTANFQTPITFTLSPITAVGYAIQLFQAGVTPSPACVGTAIGCLPSSPTNIIFTNAPANTTYYLRVFTNTATGTAGTFNICIAGTPCLTPTAVAASGVTSGSATVSWTGPVSNYVIEYGPSASFTTPGTGATAGVGGTVVTATSSPVTLTGLSASTNYLVFVRRDCGSPDGFSFNSTGILFLTSPPPAAITEGTCGLNLAIPDNGCGSGNSVSGQFPVSTVGTLGSTLVLESVDLIITHTWRSDLEIRLVSPNGTTRALILGQGGADDDFGDNANCPTGVLKLRDGAAALSTLPPSNATVGTYAPEQTLSGFSGPSNGNWQIVMCDAFGADIGALQYVKLNFANCVGPTYTTTVVPACGTNQYNVSVVVTNLGSATSYAISNSLNGSVVNVPALGTYTVGPFASGSTVNLTLTHNANPTCNANTSGITYTCPPANNACASAISISCNSVTLGSTVGADNIGNPGTCVTTLGTAPGVWYTVQGWGGTMSASTCDINAFDTKLGVFTGTCGAFTCITGNDDDFNCTSSGLASGVTWASVASTTYYIYVTGFSTNVGSFVLTTTCGQVAPPPCVANGLSIEIKPDANTAQTSWDIIPQGLSIPVCSGSGPYVAGSVIPEYCCLPNGCYRFRVLDSAGDGIVNGGYNLRTMTTGFRIIDNTDNFTTGAVSAISTTIAGGNFCLPIGTDQLIFSSCDKLNFTPNTYVVASANAAVSAQWLVGNQTDDGYEFWIFDPNGTYSFRRFRSHSVSDGFSPANAIRACHMKINSWVNTPSTPHIPQNRILNVRVRSRVNNVNTEFGPACRFRLVADVLCPQVGLQDNPNNPDFSCGVTRNFAPGGNTPANRIVARPPQFIPANVLSGNVRYQFRFRLPSEGICIIRPAQTSPTMVLNWTPGTGNNRGLECGKQYDVEVRVSRNSGATWCVDVPSVTCASPYLQWGPICKLTIGTSPVCPNATGGSSSMALQGGNGSLALYPNPNRGDQLFMNLTEVEADVNTVSVDIYDLTGKRVTARTIAVQDGFVNTVLNLNGDLSGGVYMVNITAGTKTYTERLIVQP